MAAKKGDTGHAINAVNYGKLVDAAKDLGSLYQPPSKSIELAELEKEVKPSIDVVKAVAKPKEIYDDTTDDREEQAEVVEARLKNAKANLNASDGVTDDQKERYGTACDLVSGANVSKRSRKKKKAKAAKTATGDPQSIPAVPEVTEIEHSVSQQSFDKKEANAYDGVSILETISSYQPKDTTASPANIRSEIDKFSALNKKVETDYKPYGNALKARDTKLYAPDTGSVTKARRVKEFIRRSSAFSDSQKKVFADIKFTVPAKKKLHL